jgi:hypothetical protein
MKIRITGKALAKAQVGQQTGEPTSITVNGIVYTPSHPDWERIKKENAENNASAAAIKAQVDTRMGTVSQTSNSFPIVPTFPNKVNPIPAAVPNVQQAPMAEPDKVDLSGFKPPVVAGYQEDPLEAPIDPEEVKAQKQQAKDQKAEAAYRAKYPNAPVNKTTWVGLEDQVAQRADPLGYETDQRIKNDPKYARKFARSVNGNLDKYKTIGAASNALTGAIYAAGALTDFIDNKNKQNDFNSYMRDQQMSDNLFPVKQGSRGDYVQTGTSFGQFRPDQMVVNKGMFAQYGGSLINDTETMKIRIINGPEKMAYGGQAKWSLDLGSRNIDSDMADNDYDSVSNTLREVPREEANIEAEGGETVYGDVDGDGGLEHMKINGKRHTQGGVPLNVPEGSFVFSDTKKMKIKSKTVLEMFGLNPKSDGYTPAEIAKRYDINKYKAILEDPTADDVSKSTAELMVKNYKKKLAYLSLIQESMKNFPQGIPDVAREGGLPENVLQEVEESISQGAGEQEESGQEEMMEPMGEPMEQPMYQGGGGINVSNIGLEALGFTPELLAFMQQQNPNDAERRNIANQNGMPAGWTRDAEGRLVRDTAGTEGEVMTTGTGQIADSSDPEYATFLSLLNKYDTKTVSGKKYINKLSGEDAKQFARLATKFGFSRAAKDNDPGYSVMQGSTPGYTLPNGTKNAGFFGGYTPEMYERLVAEDALGADKVATMSPLEIRKEYFKQLGVDTTGLDLNNPKKLYTNKKFFKESFYPKFVARFAKDAYRPEMGDDMQIGAEHYDSFKATPKKVGKELIGYICTGLDADGNPQIQSSSYMDNAALLSAGASTDPRVAASKCKEPIIPNKPGKNKPYDPRFGFMTPDVVNMAAAALNTPKKYLPYMAPYTATLPEPTFKDPNRELAANAEQANIMTQGLANFADPQAFMANSSGVQGKALANAADIMGRYQNDNVGIANYFAPLRSDIMNKQKLYNAERVNELWKANAIANQQYDNSKNAYRNNLARTFGQAWNNRMNLGLTNAVNPMYNIDPLSGRSFFINGYGPDKLASYNAARNVGAPDWASVGQNFAEAQRFLPGLTVSDFLRHQSGRTSSVDSDGDGLPNKTTTIKQG